MKFRRDIEALLRLGGATPATLKYHDPQSRNPRGRGWHFEQAVHVQHDGKTYGVRICQVSGSSPVQVFVARVAGKEGTGNNFHVSFSSEHRDEYGLVFVEPSLKRCRGGQLSREPQPISGYPARVCGSKALFKVGALDPDFFPRIFSIADAKYDSL